MTSSATFSHRYGPWAVVTGASSGIGEAFARELSRRGLKVVLAARRKERLETLARELTTETRIVELDQARPDVADVLGGAVADLDVGLVVANAGFGDKGELLSADRATLVRMIDTNCRGTLLVCHELVPKLVARGRGGLIVTSSTAAFVGIPHTANYAATKAYDLSLAEGLAEELRPHGVDVVALCPGATDTEGPKRTGVVAEKIPFGQMSAEDVALSGLAGLGRRVVVIPGAHNRAVSVLQKLLPRRFVAKRAGEMILRVTKRDG